MFTSKRLKKISFTIIFFAISSALISGVGAEYNVETGDAFRFEMLTLRNPWGFTYNLHISDNIVFSEGVKFLIRFTDVHPLDVDYSITIDGKTDTGNPFFDNIIVQNREWEELTERYENQGYNITETSDLWMLRQNNSTIIEADYSKKNGVMKRFYAFNESTLISVLNAGEVEIIRTTEDSISYNWAFSFLALIPITVLIVFLVKSKKFPKGKSTKKLAYEKTQFQQSAVSDELSIGYFETTSKIINGKKVEIKRTLVETSDGVKWEVTNLRTKETWFVDQE